MQNALGEVWCVGGGGGEMEGRRLVRDGCVRMLRRKFAVREGGMERDRAWSLHLMGT